MLQNKSRENTWLQKGSFKDSQWHGRLIPHSVYSLKWVWPTLVSSAWSKNQPFPQKALRQTQTWVSIIDLTLHTKDALVLLLVRLVPRAGASKKLQPALYQRRCPSWVLFPNPALPPPFNGISTYSKAGPISKHLNFTVCFQMKSFNLFRKDVFECLYVRQCTELVKGLMLLLQGIMSPRC